MADLSHPSPGIEYPKSTQELIYKLWDSAQMLKIRLIGELENRGWEYETSGTTTAEAWRIEKERLDNNLKFWRPSKLILWKANQKIPRELSEEPWNKLQTVVDRVRAEAECAQGALIWQNIASAAASLYAPETRLRCLKKWLNEYNPTKACPAVRFYRATLELYKFSVEQGWIKNMNGFGKPLSHEELDQRNGDYGKHVDDMIQKLQDQVAALAGDPTAKTSS